jgi:hypothetical protein
MTRSYRCPSDIYPSLTYDDGPAAIAWLCRAFGFTKRFEVIGPDQQVDPEGRLWYFGNYRPGEFWDASAPR